MFIDGIKLLLQSNKNISLVGEALNGKDLLDIVERLKPDIILMDINMPVINGIEATRLIKRHFPETKIIMLTMYNTKRFVTSTIAADISGYLLKNAGKDELIKAIEVVHSGGTYYSQEVGAHIIDSLRKKESHSNPNPELTDREIDVLKLLAEDYTVPQVADKLKISHYTVEAHRKNMLSKFNVHSIIAVFKIAVERGLLD